MKSYWYLGTFYSQLHGQLQQVKAPWAEAGVLSIWMPCQCIITCFTSNLMSFTETKPGSQSMETCINASIAFMDCVEVLNKVIEGRACVAEKAVHSTTGIWTSVFFTSAYVFLRGHWAIQSGTAGAVNYRFTYGCFKGPHFSQQFGIYWADGTWLAEWRRGSQWDCFETDNASNMKHPDWLCPQVCGQNDDKVASTQ